MEKLCNIINALAFIALAVAVCTIDSNLIGSLVIMFIAGAWLVLYSYLCEEKKRMRR